MILVSAVLWGIINHAQRTWYLGRPPEGAVPVGKPPWGASRSAHPGSWRGGRTEPVPRAFPRRTSQWLDRRRHLRALGSSARISDRGAEPKGTPDRSKLFGSHGQRPWLHDVVSAGPAFIPPLKGVGFRLVLKQA
jgi:hypothetical protein